MATAKDKIFRELEEMHDEALLEEVYRLLRGIRSTERIIRLNEAQKDAIESGRKDYDEGRYHSTDDLFDELMND